MKTLKCALIGIGIFIGSAPASAECTCRSRDVVANEGEVVCLNTPLGQRLARCDKVLNNSSWTFLQGACPTVSRTLTPVRHALARLQNPLWTGARQSSPAIFAKVIRRYSANQGPPIGGREPIKPTPGLVVLHDPVLRQGYRRAAIRLAGRCKGLFLKRLDVFVRPAF